MDNKIVAKKNKYFKKCIIELTNLSEIDVNNFCDSSKNIAASQAYVYGIIQTAIFLAVYTVQKHKLEDCSSYNEVFSVLCCHGKLNTDNLLEYNSFIDIRNKLLFEFDDITGEYMYDIIKKYIPIFTMYLKDINKRG